MKITDKPQLWLYGMSVGAFIVILIAPQTGWIVRRAAISLVDPQSLSNDAISAQQRSLAASHPSDYQIQLVQAIAESNTAGNTESAFEKLESRFPATPSAYANCIRMLSRFRSGNIESDPGEQAYEMGSAVRKLDIAPDPSEAVTASDLMRQAKSGQMVDPNNAFFPWILASCYYEDHQYSLAATEITQTGKDSDYQEYIQDETLGRWRESETLQGGINGVGRVAIAAAVLFPEYAKMRSCARMAVWEAMQQEKQGRVAEGTAIRISMMQLGALMRFHGTSLICNLVGIAIENIAVSSPDGIKLTPNEALPSSERVTDLINRRTQLYETYLNAHGYREQAKWVPQELAAGMRTRELIRSEISRLLDFGALVIDGALYIGSWFLLSWILIVALFGFGIFQVIKLLRNARLSGTVDGSSKVRIVVAMVGGILLLVALINDARFGFQLNMLADAVGPYTDYLTAPSQTVTTIAITSIFLVPYLVYISVMMIVNLVKRRPMVDSLVKGVTTSAGPTIAALMLCYCFCIVILAHEDQSIKETFTNSASLGEGKYIANEINLPWPALIPQPAAGT